MCGRFETTGKFTWAEIHEALSTIAPVTTPPLNLQPDDDVRPTTMQATARLERDGWVVEKMRWGLVPHWRTGKPLKDTEKSKDDGFKLSTFNARSETCAGTSTFREAYAKRRCIIPANAWFEWTGEKGAKIKHRFARADGDLIWFAGLWDHVITPDAGEFGSFTILTGPSAGWLSDYHARAPVILDPHDWEAWLDPSADARDLFAAARHERFVLC
ncbi:SOS response-associated peptidase [Brevundimonas intermedia]|uniref:SOS response-associated peptidase n=1 Tax=Brevundimonas intermedia TaxID=74315 RepID=UPI00320812B6